MGGMGAPTPASAVQGGAAAATAAPRPWLPASCGIPVAGRGEGGIWGGGWAGANGRKQMAFCQVTSTKFNFEFQIQTTYLIYHPPPKREPFRRCVEDENTTTESTCLAHHIVHVDPELAGGAHGEEELGDVVAEEGAGLGGQPAAGGGGGASGGLGKGGGITRENTGMGEQANSSPVWRGARLLDPLLGLFEGSAIISNPESDKSTFGGPNISEIERTANNSPTHAPGRRIHTSEIGIV